MCQASDDYKEYKAINQSIAEGDKLRKYISGVFFVCPSCSRKAFDGKTPDDPAEELVMRVGDELTCCWCDATFTLCLTTTDSRFDFEE
jgi:hypothetical protein